MISRYEKINISCGFIIFDCGIFRLRWRFKFKGRHAVTDYSDNANWMQISKVSLIFIIKIKIINNNEGIEFLKL